MSEKSKLKAVSKTKPCEICDAKDGCKRNSKGLNICRRRNTKEDTSADYIYLGTAKKNPEWGLYLHKDYQEIIEHPQHKVSPGLLFDPKPKILSITERSIQYKKIVDGLDLHFSHVQWLKNRSYPKQLVQYLYELGVRSYRDGLDNLPEGLSPELPGLDGTGIPLLTPYLCQSGLLLPMPDWDNLILGFQVVPHRRIVVENQGESYDGPKYLWLSTESDVRLPKPYNSVPHGFFTPPINRDPETLLLTEGALKGAVTAYLSDHYVLSTASGGLFNHTQLAAAISAKGIKHVLLCPDAGMLNNELISLAYDDTLAMAEGLGVTTEIIWWEQFTKDELDIDEYLLYYEEDHIFGPE